MDFILVEMQQEIGVLGDIIQVPNILQKQGLLVSDGNNRGFRLYNSDDFSVPFFVNSSGNVGIGTTSPSTYLVVGEDGGGHATNTPGIHMKSTTSETLHYTVGQDSTHNVFLAYYANSTVENGYASLHTYSGSNHLCLQRDGGNVGIGTTSPDAKFQVSSTGGTTLKITNSTSRRAELYLQTVNDEANDLFFFQNNSTHWSLSGRSSSEFYDLRFYAKNTNWDNIMTLKKTGKVGIGTSSPSTYGNLAVTPTGGSNEGEYYGITLEKADQTQLWKVAKNDNDTAYMHFYNSGSVSVTINGKTNEKSYFNTGGNFGIGTSSPLTKLQIGNIAYIRKDNATYGTNDAVLINHPTVSSNTAINDPKDLLILSRGGTSNEAWLQQAHMRLCRYENSGTYSRTRLDFALLHNSGGTDEQNGAAPPTVMTMRSDGNVGYRCYG